MHSFDEYKTLVDESLVSYLPDPGSHAYILKEAMSYSLSMGGKRIRPVLLLASCELAGGDINRALPYACAVEFIHTYSLIHDDLPAMDDDDMRRGNPSNHKIYGEAIAILAGDGLLNSAAELISSQALSLKNDADALYAHARASHEILSRAGASGMIAGQTADVINEGKESGADLVRFIEEHKTADLIIAPVRAGLMLAEASEDTLEDFSKYAFNIGVAFQISDDILDYEGDADLMGKTLGKDATQDKCSYVNVHGMEAAKKELKRLTNEAIEAVESYEKSEFFIKLAYDLKNRTY